MDNNKALTAHLSMLGACVMWGLMAPIGKTAMMNGIDGITDFMARAVNALYLIRLLNFFNHRTDGKLLNGAFRNGLFKQKQMHISFID